MKVRSKTLPKKKVLPPKNTEMNSDLPPEGGWRYFRAFSTKGDPRRGGGEGIAIAMNQEEHCRPYLGR